MFIITAVGVFVIKKKTHTHTFWKKKSLKTVKKKEASKPLLVSLLAHVHLCLLCAYLDQTLKIIYKTLAIEEKPTELSFFFPVSITPSEEFAHLPVCCDFSSSPRLFTAINLEPILHGYDGSCR